MEAELRQTRGQQMELAPRKIETPRGVLELRMAGTEDAEQFRDLRLTALRTSPGAFGSSYEEQVDDTIDAWRARLSGPAVRAVLDSGSALLGMAVLAPEQGIKVRHRASIFGVFVRQEWRGLGLGAAIIEALLEVARADAQIRQVELSVNTTNTVALRLYERLGFRTYGTLPAALLVNGVYYDEHLMALTIGS